jgi:hypothetical protein
VKEKKTPEEHRNSLGEKKEAEKQKKEQEKIKRKMDKEWENILGAYSGRNRR